MGLASVLMELLMFMAIILLIFPGNSITEILLELVSLSIKGVDVHGLREMVLYKIPQASNNASSISKLKKTVMIRQRQKNKTSRLF